MTELEKLDARLFGDPNKKLTGFNVWWGPDAVDLSVEERAKVLNDVFDQVDNGKSSVLDFEDSNFGKAPKSRQPPVSLDDFVKGL